MIFRVLVIVSLTLAFQKSQAQPTDCTCHDYFLEMDTHLKATPAYKQNKQSYQEAYARVRTNITELNAGFECYVQLGALALSLNDNHIKIYGRQIQKEQKEPWQNESVVMAKLNGQDANAESLAILEKRLSTAPTDSIEGVYYWGDAFTLGVHHNTKVDRWEVVVLFSNRPHWKRGELLYTLIPYGAGYHLAIGRNATDKRYISFTERIAQGVFMNTGIRKDSSRINYFEAPFKDSLFLYKTLSDRVAYVKAGSFNSFYPILAEAEKFYARLQSTLNQEYLILDLRDNAGGGQRNSDILLKILKDYSQHGSIYVLVNHKTISNAEQFVLKLMENGSCVIAGTRTNGTLSYEIKEASKELACGDYIAVVTAKKHKKYLDYESVGIVPEVPLDMQRDWIDQIIDLIEERD